MLKSENFVRFTPNARTSSTGQASISSSTALPFLKWAGGKRWLVDSHIHLTPKTFNAYFEPFLGSGAVFFALQPRKALLCDLNQELISTYKWVRKAPVLVGKLLSKYQKSHGPDHYYKLRDSKTTSGVELAARLIYLNRTCFNGLYRVNLKGTFNVPIGSKTTVILDSDNFTHTAKLLRGIDIRCQDFQKTIDEAQKGDFIFVDPPYTIAHNNNGFIKYNQTLFSWQDQVRLKVALDSCTRRGSYFLLLNANHVSIRNLYADYEQKTLRRMSILAGGNYGRGQVEEVAITNY
jgi:DNA adenine methylase